MFCCLLLTAGYAQAQSCKGYYYLLNNAMVEMSVYDDKGDAIGKNVYKVGQVKNEGDGKGSDFTSTFYDKDGKVVTTGEGHFRCTGTGVEMDMKMNMPSLPQTKDLKMKTTSGYFLDYPAAMKAGQELKGGTMEMSGNMNGMDINMTYSIKNRKVMDKEQISSPAGKWDAWKIGYDVVLEMTVLGKSIPVTMRTVEWFAPGFGPVKSEVFDKSGKKTGGTLITALKK